MMAFHSYQSSIRVIALLYLSSIILLIAHNQEALAKEENTKKTCLVIRIAIFVDIFLKNHFGENLKLTDSQVNGLLQSYIKQVEAIFLNLRVKSVYKIHLELVETRLEKFEREFSNNVSFTSANIDQLLDEFCQYQHKLRPRTWDLSLLLTSQDLYSEEETKLFGSHELSLTTMGISIINGIDWHDLSCSIVEFGVGYDDENLIDSEEKRVYPTRGFGSAWIAAHEIGHSLGIYHDGSPFNEDCPTTGYIMSSSNYITSTPTKWSHCSSNSLDSRDLRFLSAQHDHDDDLVESANLIRNLPGQLLDAEFQCKAFSKSLIQVDKMSGNGMCNESLLCSTERGQSIPIGPALEGTQCELDGSMCIENSCTLLKGVA